MQSTMLEARILRVLATLPAPARATDLLNCSELESATIVDVNQALDALHGLGLVDRFADEMEWLINSAGRAALETSADCEVPPPEIAPAAHAFLCFSENELDDWWAGLEVEQKADAFAGFSLRAQGQDESFVHVPETRVPVRGFIDKEEVQFIALKAVVDTFERANQAFERAALRTDKAVQV